MRLVFKTLLVAVILLTSQYSLSEDKAPAAKKEVESKEKKAKQKVKEKKESKKKKKATKKKESVTTELEPAAPIIAQIDNSKVNVGIEIYDGFARTVFSGINYYDLNPIIEGDNVVIDLKKSAQMNVAGFNSNNRYIKSYGLANDDRSIVFRMKNPSSKLRKFITDNGVGFDIFVSREILAAQSQETPLPQKKNVIVMSELPDDKSGAEKPDQEKKGKKKVSEEVAIIPEIPENPLIVTYPLEYIGPPEKDQIYKLEDDFVGPLASDFNNFKIYEIVRGFDDKVIEPTFTPDKKSMLMSFRFSNPEIIGTGLFRINDSLYLAFDIKKPFYLDGFVENNFVNSVKEIKNKKFSLLKLDLKGKFLNDYKFLAYRDKTAWNVEIHGKNSNLKDPFAKQFKYFAEAKFGENRFSFKLKNISKQGVLEDKTTGEKIKFFTTTENGVGNIEKREFVDLTIEPSAQGLVIREKADFISYDYDKDDSEKLFLTKLPNLFLSDEILAVSDSLASEKQQARRAHGIFSDQSIFPFPKALKALKEKEEKKLATNQSSETSDKEKPDAAEKKEANKNLPPTKSALQEADELFTKIVYAPANEKSVLKKQLADFYFSKKMYAESLGILSDIIANDPTFPEIFNVRAMYAATQFFTSKYDDARTSFDELLAESQNNPASNELKLWKWLSAYKNNKQRRVVEELEDIDFVASFDKFMQQYPKNIRFQMGLNYIDYLMAHQKSDDAKNILEIISYNGVPAEFTNDVKLLNAKFLFLAGNYDDAEKTYQEVTLDLNDRKNRALAMFEYNKQRLKLEQIQYPEAIKNFLQAATIWRDDYFEMDVLESVGNIQLSNSKYMDSLEAWRSLVQNFPQTAESVFVLGKMKDVFIDLFDGGKVYELPPLEVLKIYFRFRELMPVGEVGDRITRKVAKYFLDTDMVDDGIEIIRHQAVYRSKGDEKADLVLWLSNIYDNDDRIDDGIRILDLLKKDVISADKANQVKNQKALLIAKKGKLDEALEMVKDDFSYTADSVRVEVFSQRGNWFGIMDKIEPRLAGFIDTFPDPLTEDQMNNLFVLAIAYASQGENEKLVKLNNDFRKRLEDEDDLKLFDYLISGNSKLDYTAFESSSESNKIQSFLNEYSYLPGNDWQAVANILEPKVDLLVGKISEELSDEDRNNVVRLALSYSKLIEIGDERTILDSKKKLSNLSRNFKDVKVDRNTIVAFSILDDKIVPKDPDAVFEGKIRLADIPEFITFYINAPKLSSLNISIREKFK